METLGKLRPAFKEGGSTTAGCTFIRYFQLNLFHFNRKFKGKKKLT